MGYLQGGLSVILFSCIVAEGVTVYETIDPYADEYGGGWDVNIFADDVHFNSGGIITNLTMNLAIKGTGQTCRVWIFDQLGQDALHTISFTNQPSSSLFDFKPYDFPMYLSVPADIYVGFSAEGDGWGTQLEDASALATTLSSGFESGDGFYWWGAAAGGRLVQGANFSSHDYFELKIDMIQPVITDFKIDAGDARLTVTNISEYATYLVERSSDLSSNIWSTAGEFMTNAALASWSEPVSNSWLNVNYRISTKPE